MSGNEVATDAPKKDHDKEPDEKAPSGDTPDGGIATTATPVRKVDDIVKNSLDRAGGGAAHAEAPALSDALLAPPSRNFGWNVQRMAMEQNIASGNVGVSYKSLTYIDQKGQERQIAGPASYNLHGQQFIIDQQSMLRYRVIPPNEDGGSATIRAVGRRGGNEPMTVVEQKNFEPYGRHPGTHPDQPGGKPGVKPAEGGPPATADGGTPRVEKAKTGKVEDPVVKDPKDTKVTTPVVNPTIPITTEVTQPVAQQPVAKQEIPGLKPDVPIVKPGVPVDAHPPNVVDPVKAKLLDRGEGEDGGKPHKERERERTDPATVADVQKEIARLARLEQPGKPDPTTPQKPEIVIRAVPPLTPERVEDLRKAIAADPSILDRLRFERQPDLRHEPRPGQDPNARPGGDPNARPGGDKPVVDKGQPIVFDPNSDKNRLPMNPNQLEGRGLNPSNQNAPNLERKPVELVLADVMKNKELRPALVEFLTNLQQGKLPTEANLQNNRQLLDVIKLIGPQGLADIRKALTESEVTGLGKVGVAKLDPAVGTLRDTIDFITNPGTRRKEGDLSSPVTGALVSERLLDIIRQNEKLNGQRIPDGDATRTTMLELGKIIRDMNNAQGLEPGKGITFRDIIGRSLDDGKNLGLPTERRDFLMRPPSGEEMVVRALLDRTTQKDGETRRPIVELSTRAEILGARQDQREPKIDAKIDPKLEVKPDTKLDTKIEAKVEGKVDLRPETLIKPEDIIRGTKELTAKPDGTQPVARTDRLVDSDQIQPKTEQQVKAQQADSQNKDDDSERHHKPKDLKHKDKDQEDEIRQQMDAAALAALAAKKRKEAEANDKQESTQEKDKKEPEKRQKYIVKPGDTLDSIAAKMLRDKQLAGLIYDINKDAIPTTMIGGKKVPKLQERMTIWLPTPTEAKDYRGRLMSSQAGAKSEHTSAEDELTARFGQNWSGAKSTSAGTTSSAALEDMEEAARVAYQARRQHIESLLGPLAPKSQAGKPKHVVRLDETLKSVATKHPALRDVVLWKLVAELNGLSTKTDEKGNPIAKLNRGQSIILPTVAEIEEYRRRETGGAGREKFSGPLELPSRSCPKCERSTFASALLCPACGAQFEDSVTRPTATTGSSTVRTGGTTSSTGPAVGPSSAPALPKAEDSTRIIHNSSEPAPISLEFTKKKEFSQTARLMTAGTIGDLSAGYILRLETLDNGEWMPLVVYEVFVGVCLRHEYNTKGERKTIRIDLPPQAAIELASNDLESNWSAFKSKYESAKAPI